MSEAEITGLSVIGGVAFIGALVLAWIHKIGYRISGVLKEEFPGFIRRFLAQILAVVFCGVILCGTGKLIALGSEELSKDINFLLQITVALNSLTENIVSNPDNSIFVFSLIAAITGLISSIIYWASLTVAGKVVYSTIGIKQQIVAAGIPSLIVFILYLAPTVFIAASKLPA